MAKKVAVIGGGVVGMAAALFLQENYTVTLFERESEPKPLGAGIMLQPSGLAILDKLGVVDPILDRGQKIQGFYGENYTGSVDFNIDFKKFDVYGYGVQRGSLYYELLEKVKESDICLNFGVEVVDLTKDLPIVVKASTGETFESFDFVIVANGARSLLRSKFGDILRFEGTTGPAALWAKVDGDGSELQNKIHQYYYGTKFMVGLMPIGQEKSSIESFKFNFFSGISENYVQQWDKISLQEWKNDMRKVSANIDYYLNQITSKDDLVMAPYHDVQLKRYSKGNVLFIGDAAHAMGPHLSSGTNLGLIDAYTIAQVLQQGGSVCEGFKKYEKLRRNQLSYYQLISRLITPYFQSDVDKSFLRKIFLSTAAKTPFLNNVIIETITGRRINMFKKVDKKMYFNDRRV